MMTRPTPTVLDIEASGFGRKSYPIEVGYARPNGELFCALILPQPEWTHWDSQAQKLHHISREILLSRGHPAVNIARQLNENLRGQTVYSDGWANDYSWLAILYDAAEMSPSFKLDNLRALLVDAQADVWHQVKEQVAREIGPQRHRASSDAKLLQLTYQRLLQGPDSV